MIKIISTSYRRHLGHAPCGATFDGLCYKTLRYESNFLTGGILNMTNANGGWWKADTYSQEINVILRPSESRMSFLTSGKELFNLTQFSN